MRVGRGDAPARFRRSAPDRAGVVCEVRSLGRGANDPGGDDRTDPRSLRSGGRAGVVNHRFADGEIRSDAKGPRPRWASGSSARARLKVVLGDFGDRRDELAAFLAKRQVRDRLEISSRPPAIAEVPEDHFQPGSRG